LPKGREGRPTKRQSAKKKQFADGEKKLKMQNTVINNYHIQRELGRGGMAIVYLAEHQLLHNKVAIKVLNDDYVRNSNIRNRFLSEARNMARMAHTNIIKVTDLIEEGDTVAFVMEYIEGETLKDYLERKGKLGDNEIKSIFSQMLDAVGYVHEQKLVHRDIKPSNFMITPSGKVKLMDFGIAKNTDSSSAEYTQTGTGVQMGTPMYMSPEQIKSTKAVTSSTDIYSLGVLLWQMVAGRKPYNQEELSVPEIQVSILKAELPKTGQKTWDLLIQKATAKEAEKRYVSCHSFKEAISNSHNGPSDHTVVDAPDFEQTVVEKQRPAVKTDAHGIEFIWVEGGTFEMGSPQNQVNRENDEIQHRVTLDGYYMAKYPVTQAQWVKVMGSNPAYFQANGSDCPVERASWKDCQQFIEKINQQLGCNYRLPTEAEWEFAARGGIKSKGYKYSGSDNIDEVAWYAGNRCVEIEKSTFIGLLKKMEKQYLGTHPVGKKKSNELGIYDMSGNVWEWCADWYGDYPTAAQTNPQGPLSGSNRVFRGGGWHSDALHCRSADRFSITPVNRYNFVGFRLVSPQA
jgi:serine/threonine protein kinase